MLVRLTICLGAIAAFAAGATTPGRLDTSFIPSSAPNGPVRAILPLSNGSVIIGGEFTQIGNVSQPYLAKYREDGSLDTTFHPALDGAVRVLESTLKGGFFAGGEFNTVNGSSAVKLARLYDSGVLDTSFSAGSGFDGPVHTVKQSLISGMPLLVGGAFNTYRGAAAKNLAGLASNGTLQRNYAVNGPVKALAKDFTTTNFVFGGSFSYVGAIPAANLAIANQSGISSNSYATNGEVTDLVFYDSFSGTQALVIGGSFTTRNNAPAPGIAALAKGSGVPFAVSFAASGATNGSAFAVDSESRLMAGNAGGGLWRFNMTASSASWPAISNFLPSAHADGKIDAIAQEPGLRYYIGGDFTSVDGQPVSFFARLYGPQGGDVPPGAVVTGATATDDRAQIKVQSMTYALEYDVETSGDGGTTWQSGFSSAASSIPVTGLRAGETYQARARARNANGWGAFGASFTFSTPAPRRSGPAIYMPLPGDWAVGNWQVDDLFVDAAGRLAIVGPNDFLGTLFGGFAVLNNRLRMLFSLNATNDPRASLVAPAPDGYVIFTEAYLPLQKLDANGTPVTTFIPAYQPSYQLRDMAVQSDGKIILAGSMTIAEGAPNNAIVRLNANGAVDTAFHPLFLNGNSTVYIYEVTVLAGNRLLLVGDFTSIDGTPRMGIAILTATGAVDMSFTPDATVSNWNIDTAAPDPQGRIVIGGYLGNVGDYRAGVGRLLANGTIDPAWVPPVMKATSSVSVPKIAVQPDGKVIACGSFSTVNDHQACGLARLDVDGSLDTNFDVGLGPRSTSGSIVAPMTVAILPDSSIAVGGDFKLFDGEKREGFVLLRGDHMPSDFDLWLAAQDLPATGNPAADDDGDGMGLAMEFAFELNPRAPDFLPVVTSRQGMARLKPPSRRGIKAIGYFSSSLESWEPVPVDAAWTIHPPTGSGVGGGFFRFGLDPENSPE